MPKRRPRGTGTIWRPKSNGVEQGVWWIAYYVRGKRVRESTQTTFKSDAERVLRSRIMAIDTGRIGDPLAARTTLNDLETFVLTDYKNNGRRSWRDVGRGFQRLRDHFGGDFLARDIDEAVLAQFKAKRLGTGAAHATINRDLAHLKRGLRLAVRFRRLATEPKFSMLREGRPRQGFLEPEQFEAIARELPADLRPLVTFLYWTGWRVGEAKGLEWRMVDLRAGVIRIEESKNDAARTIPYAALPALQVVIDEQRAATTALEKRTGRIIPWVFHRAGEPVVAFVGAWEGACLRAGLPGRLVHDMRRSAARNMIRAGVSQSVAMAIGGWKTDSVFRRYAIVDEKVIAEGLAKLRSLSTGK